MCAVAERDERAGHAASSAKAAIGECQALVTRQAVEIVGAAGALDDVRLWVGRAKADDLLFGSAADHRRIVADQTLNSRRARTSQLASALLG
jgi:alkylation response protein AidB-like acyl-CoA dehydrogenase